MSPSDYEGLHRRYAQFLNDNGFSASIDSLDINRPLSIPLASDDEQSSIQEILTPLFEGMMRTLFRQKGATFNVEILADQPAQDFISAHAAILDSGFQQVPMSDAMRQRLTRSDYIFSGIKTFHELNEAFPSLLDENGNRKPFEQFLKDVRKIDSTYNEQYLRAEYNFVQQSASMAAKWEEFMEDGDRYYLQYRTAGDDHVRPAHAALNGITLPPSDSFWTDYYPPNGWNCRCTVVQVRKSKYPATPHDEAMSLGEEALGDDTKGIFRFNAGQQQKTMPDYNPYTIRRCNDCDIAKGNIKLAKALVPDNEVCAACKLIRKCYGDKSKSAAAIRKSHYKHEMRTLKDKAVPATLRNGRKIKIKFDERCIAHLYSDTFKRCRAILPDDLKNMDRFLATATLVGEAPKEQGHNNPFVYFYYFAAKVNGKKFYINIGKRLKKQKNGSIKTLYYCYSIKDKIKRRD